MVWALAGTHWRSRSSFADITASAGHGDSTLQVVPGRELAGQPDAALKHGTHGLHVMPGSALPTEAGPSNDSTSSPSRARRASTHDHHQQDAEIIEEFPFAQSPALESPNEAKPEAGAATLAPGSQQDLAATDLDDLSAMSNGTSDARSQLGANSTQQAGTAVGGVLERMSRQASGPQAAEAPGASKPSDQPDEMALLARLALDQLKVGEADAPEEALPKETVTIVQRTDGFVTSDQQRNIGATFQLLPLDPQGILQPGIPKMPDAKDLQIPPGKWTAHS